MKEDVYEAGRDGLCEESDSEESERVAVRSARALALTSSRAGIEKFTGLLATEDEFVIRRDDPPAVSQWHAAADVNSSEAGGMTHQGDQGRTVADTVADTGCSGFLSFSVLVARTSAGKSMSHGKPLSNSDGYTTNFRSFLLEHPILGHKHSVNGKTVIPTKYVARIQGSILISLQFK